MPSAGHSGTGHGYRYRCGRIFFYRTGKNRGNRQRSGGQPREIFEEAAGIVKYRSKKAEAEKKLLTADRNLDRVNDIIADLETRIGPLKAEAERAEEYLQLSREYAETETGIIVRSIAAIGEASESLKNQIDDTERQIAEVRREKEAVSARIADLAAQASVLDREDLAERDRMMEFAGRLSELRNTKKYMGERILTLQERIQALGEEQKALNFRLEEEQESRQASAEKVVALQRELTAVQQMLHQKNELFLQDSRNLKESENRAEDGRNRLLRSGDRDFFHISGNFRHEKSQRFSAGSL